MEECLGLHSSSKGSVQLEIQGPAFPSLDLTNPPQAPSQVDKLRVGSVGPGR